MSLKRKATTLVPLSAHPSFKGHEKIADELYKNDKKGLFILDEPMHSTPPIEGISVAYAFSQYLAKMKNRKRKPGTKIKIIYGDGSEIIFENMKDIIEKIESIKVLNSALLNPANWN